LFLKSVGNLLRCTNHLTISRI